MKPPLGKPGPSPLGLFLELNSERVREALPQLTAWRPHLGGLEGRFRFRDGTEALAFLRRLTALLDQHPEPPSRLALTGPILSIGLGLSNPTNGVYSADLALAQRITALRNVMTSLPSERSTRLG